MTLLDLANPTRFLHLTARILPWLAAATAILLLVGLYQAAMAPDDYQQGATVKIIYLHVPAALMAINAWIMMLVASLIWFIRRHHVSALAARAAAPVGATFTLVADLLAEHALRDAGALEEALVALGMLLPADPGRNGAEQNQPESQGADVRQGLHGEYHACHLGLQPSVGLRRAGAVSWRNRCEGERACIRSA
jgi:hypothetical protein